MTFGVGSKGQNTIRYILVDSQWGAIKCALDKDTFIHARIQRGGRGIDLPGISQLVYCHKREASLSFISLRKVGAILIN